MTRLFPTHAARPAVLALTLALGAMPLTAQQSAGTWQVRISSGRLVATGDQRTTLKDAPVIAAQVSRTISADLALTTSLGWARSRDLARADMPRLDILSGDLGLEQTVTRWRLGRDASFTPFVGLGAGARRYDSRAEGAEGTTLATGYLAVGGELGIGRVGIRIEARDYATNARGHAGLQQEMVLMGALRFNRQRVP